MVRGSKIDRRGSGPIWFLVLALVLFALYSLAVAISTQDDCGDGAGKEWQYLPPEWKCTASQSG